MSVGSCTIFWLCFREMWLGFFPDQMMFCNVGQILYEYNVVFSNREMFKEAVQLGK